MKMRIFGMRCMRQRHMSIGRRCSPINSPIHGDPARLPLDSIRSDPFLREVPMRITGVKAYRLDLPFRDAPYVCSGGRSAIGFDSLVVGLETDTEFVGYGEMAPLGAFYDPAFAAGARAALLELAPLLLGQDPTQTAALGRRLDFHLKGHPYA